MPSWFFRRAKECHIRSYFWQHWWNRRGATFEGLSPWMSRSSSSIIIVIRFEQRRMASFPKASSRKLTWESAWFQSFGRFMQFPVFLVCPKEKFAAQCSSLMLLCPVWLKMFGHGLVGRDWKVGSSTWITHIYTCPHNSRRVQRCLKASRAERLPHSADSPDLTASDFFLFGYIRGKPSDYNCESREDRLNAITEIFTGVNQEALLNVFESWVNRF
jgi:hypothetical protein